MLTVVVVISCVSMCGFYIYVLVQLQRERKRGTDDSQSSRREAASHRETMLGIGFSIAGLLALFAGTELLNSFATWLH